ncbi:MAG: hypothetical protein MUP27_08915 [Desulfobacterales bacterium]|nr:hypothetical protein [Desulfobacterales bacterium]
MAKKKVAKGKIKTEEIKKKLLLNKSSLGIVAFASKEESRYNVNVLHVEKDYVEATTGSILVRLSHPKANPDEFPITPGEPFDDKINFMLPVESIKGIKISTKSCLPILSNVCLSKEEEMINVSTTNLDVMQTTKIKPVDGEFPDTEQFIDKSIDEENNEWKMFTVNSDLLKVLADYVSRRNGKYEIPITFWVKDPEGVVHFRFRFIDTEQDGRGVLMPMKGSDVRKGLGLV